ncbi:MAG: class I SAM-dependent methyltransferase [Phycisphaerales bacterium]|nr:class I SAM-dependent methyltransferase [Phycisphaerales bacterium]MCB9837183.1 class I SAM-dependent methyltransferase [Phycisphaera sp.]
MSGSATSCELIATAAFGVESSVKWELSRLGYEAKGDQPGRLVFHAGPEAIARTNLYLRAADRVLMVVGRFEARDFDALYEGIRAIDWKQWVPQGAKITPYANAVRSPITSERSSQSIVKRAIVDALAGKGGSIREDADELAVDVSILGTAVTVSLDTSGAGLHKRGYRPRAQAGQLKETLGAALVLTCRWKRDQPLVDPFCGSGTIPIEAALLASNRAPGMHRSFASESWPWLSASLWKKARDEAQSMIDDTGIAPIVGSDINPQAVGLARQCAKNAGVEHLVRFELADYRALRAEHARGWIISNPPYGVRVGEEKEAEAIHRDLPEVIARMPGWSAGLLLAGEEFERRIGRIATHRRKLYNARIQCTFYQYLAHDGSVAIESRTEVGNLDAFQSGLAKRARHVRKWPESRDVFAYRLFEGEVGGVPIVIDRLGDALRVHDLGDAENASASRMNRVERIAAAAREALEWPEQATAVVHAGEGQSHKRTQETCVVRERGVQFEVRPGEPDEAGIDLALREARQWVAQRAAGKCVLDVSARPGLLTEAAAMVASHLEAVTPDEHTEARLRRNLHLNGVSESSVTISRGRALASIDDIEPGDGHDLILCVLSSAEAREIAPAFGDLLESCADLLAPGGLVLLAVPASEVEERFEIAVARDLTRSLHPEDIKPSSGYRFWTLRAGGD